MMLVPSIAIVSPLVEVCQANACHCANIHSKLDQEDILLRVADIDSGPRIIFNQELAETMVTDSQYDKFVYDFKHEYFR